MSCKTLETCASIDKLLCKETPSNFKVSTLIMPKMGAGKFSLKKIILQDLDLFNVKLFLLPMTQCDQAQP